MDITYREARPEDLPECVHLFNESVADLRKRHGLPISPQQNSAARLAALQHSYSTGFFHLAQQGAKIVAFASAILRERLWFLSGFWALPAVQQKHVGMPLLRRVWDEGRKAGATTFFVWSSPDLPAMAAYMKMGMLPGTQILFFEGAPNAVAAPAAAYTTQPLNKPVAMGLDKVMLGTRREADHDYLARSGWQGIQVLRGGISVGYYYLREGVIGPAAWTHPRHSDAILALACRGLDHVTLYIPGTNHDALQFSLKAGLRLTGYAHLLMSSPFGHLDRYLPSGPALF